MKLLSQALLGLFLVGCTWNIAHADTITPGVLYGSGNGNQYFTVVQNNGVEIGLKAKLRYISDDDSIPGDNNPEGVYYSQNILYAGSTTLADWNLDWSVNTNFDGSGGVLANYTYLLSVDYDPLASGGTAASTSFDPLYDGNDNAYGTNATTASTRLFIGTDGTLAEIHGANNVSQNSTNVGFFGMSPENYGLYTIVFSVYDVSDALQENPIASNQILVYAGVEPPSAVPEPTSMAILGMGVLGFVGGGVARRRLKQKQEASNS